MKFESLKKPLSLSLLLVFLYVIAILLMCYLKIITLENLILSFATAFGWLIALVIAIIHLSGARSDNQAALEYEIRKNIEIEAFKDINRAVDELSSKIGSVSNVFLSLPINYKSHKENPLIVKFDKIQLSQEIMHKGVELLKTYADFILSIESNEIAVIEFDYYRKYIQFQIEDFKELIRKFETYFNKLNLDALNSLDVFSEFKAKCDSLFEMSCTIQSYLFDYRILLMNSFLEDVFKKKVPERETRDPKYKLLTEVAKKEEVEKEEKKREEAAIRRKKDNGKSA